ncbi:YbaN family protein [Gilliamella sp. B2776]|uniref:YbaN family protein n=1 Tax=unclassified Gilliamella TaxID=2685620 RepID=UPI00226A2A44|nr:MULTISPECIES: YbaN family protein [unclassified Gilliamella]MCX8650851.1 YbaN family protein [Gilliamella sp. B2779]MCX8653906.1 YbaN family protein [Gilliamella sp. B2737]MCX8657267.1 YbaN family protein [Gilliamella sp. B2894]MCX8665893.1 YbaN family protein [Gilliamella sp. B2887]MCX8691478.1 YbaN family protein [Gilliamella sp. B2776]
MLKKSLFIFLGSLSFVLGTVGIFVPILPTVPFYLLTAYLWLNSSDRLYAYFTKSKYYQIYIQKMFIEKKATQSSLFKMLLMVFVALFIPFVIFNSLHVRIILVIVFLAHLIFGYVIFNKK